jgi:hypothetical protein
MLFLQATLVLGRLHVAAADLLEPHASWWKHWQKQLHSCLQLPVAAVSWLAALARQFHFCSHDSTLLGTYEDL